MAAFRYRIVTEWSDEDQAYIARVPALGFTCSADGPTPAKAAKEVMVVAGMFLESMAEDGDPIPPPDVGCKLDKAG